jgi:hypothetical protein
MPFITIRSTHPLQTPRQGHIMKKDGRTKPIGACRSRPLLSKRRKPYNRQRKFEQHKRRRAREEERKRELKEFAARQALPYIAVFSRDVRRKALHMRNYITAGRGQASKLSLAQKIELLREDLPSDAPFLALNNSEARIRFQRIWMHHIRMFNCSRQTCHHMTITPKRFVVPMNVAQEFDPFTLQQWVCQQLRCFNLIGIVEGGFYSNGGEDGRPVMSWHVHIFMFDACPIALEAVIRRLNQDFEPLTRGRKVADARQIKPGDNGLMTVASYMAKESLQEYRKYEKKSAPDELSDLDDRIPSATEIPACEEMQLKQPARPGVRLIIRRAMRGKHFDKMIFASGDCRPLLQTIRSDLLVGLPWSKRRDREAKYSGCFEGRPTLRMNASPWIRRLYGYHEPVFDEVALQAACFGHPDSPEYEREQERLKWLRDP